MINYAYLVGMSQRAPIELLEMKDEDPPELQVLKTRYNRYAEQLNATKDEEWSQEDEALEIELEYITREIKKHA